VQVVNTLWEAKELSLRLFSANPHAAPAEVFIQILEMNGADRWRHLGQTGAGPGPRECIGFGETAVLALNAPAPAGYGAVFQLERPGCSRPCVLGHTLGADGAPVLAPLGAQEGAVLGEDRDWGDTLVVDARRDSQAAESKEPPAS